MPGARPTISSAGFAGPNGPTGLLKYSGYSRAFFARKDASRGHSVQSGQNVPDATDERRVPLRPHALDDRVSEARAGHQRRTRDQALQILFDVLARGDVALRGADRFAQAREIVRH